MATQQELISRIQASITDLVNQAGELSIDTGSAAMQLANALGAEGNPNSAQRVRDTVNLFWEQFSIPLATLAGILTDLLELYGMLSAEDQSVLLRWLREVNESLSQTEESSNG